MTGPHDAAEHSAAPLSEDDPTPAVAPQDTTWLCHLDPQGVIQEEGAALQLGEASEEKSAWLDRVHTGDRRVAEQAMGRIQQQGGRAEVTVRYRLAGDAFRWLAWDLQAASPSGSIHAKARDVTEARHAQQTEELTRVVTKLCTHRGTLTHVLRMVPRLLGTQFGVILGATYEVEDGTLSNVARHAEDQADHPELDRLAEKAYETEGAVQHQATSGLSQVALPVLCEESVLAVVAAGVEAEHEERLRSMLETITSTMAAASAEAPPAAQEETNESTDVPPAEREAPEAAVTEDAETPAPETEDPAPAEDSAPAEDQATADPDEPARADDPAVQEDPGEASEEHVVAMAAEGAKAPGEVAPSEVQPAPEAVPALEATPVEPVERLGGSPSEWAQRQPAVAIHDAFHSVQEAMDRAAARVEALEAQLTRAHADLDEARAEARRHAEEAQRSQHHLSTLQERLDEAERKGEAALREAQASAKAEEQHFEDALQAARAEAEEQRRQRADTEARAAEAAAARQEAAQALDEVQEEAASLREQLDQSRQEQGKLTQQLEAAAEELEQAREAQRASQAAQETLQEQTTSTQEQLEHAQTQLSAAQAAEQAAQESAGEAARERDAAQKERDLVRRRLTHLVAQVPDPVLIVAPDRTILYTSPALEGQTGHTAATLKGAKVERLFHPDDVPAFKEALKRVVTRDVASERLQLRCRTTNEGWMQYDLTLTNHLEEPSLRGVIVAARNVTAQARHQAKAKALTERFKVLAAHQQDIACVHQRSGKILWVNAAAERILGHDDQALIGTTWAEHVHPDDRPTLEDAFVEPTPSASPVALTARFRAADDTYRTCAVTLVTYEERPGVPPRVMSLMRDLTAQNQQADTVETQARELARLEAELKARHEAAEAEKQQLSEVREEAASAQATVQLYRTSLERDVRTVLQETEALAGHLAGLSSHGLAEDQVALLHTISETACGLVDEILTATTQEMDPREAVEEAVHVEQACLQAVRAVSFAAHAKELDVVLDVHPDVPSWIQIDQAWLQQILVNVCTQATRMTEVGDVVVKATVDPEHEQVHIAVRDAGPSRTDAYLRHLLNMEAEADPSVGRQAGLTLKLTRDLCQRMGGDLSATHGEGGGVVYTVTLPLKPADAPEASAAPSLDSLQGKHVLVVEDHPPTSAVLKRWLASHEADRTIVRSGVEAIRLLTDGARVDAVLVDQTLTKMDGPTLIKAIQAQWADLPTILMRPLGVAPDADAPEHQVTKPLHADSLVTSIHTALSATETAPPNTEVDTTDA
ncbi:MAG: PAS domain-containing protein [Bacteroidota bacterium]